MQETRADIVSDYSSSLSPHLGFPEFSDDVIIDLRDPSVADGLAQMLERFTELGEEKGAAEARAEIALHDRLATSGKLRSLTQDLEQERAEGHRLEVDNAELRRENNVRLEQLAQADRELATLQMELRRTREAMDELTGATDDLIDWLQTELREKERANATLEALISRRRRRDFDRLMGE